MSIGEGTRGERDVRTLPTHGVSVPSQLSGHFWTGSVLNSLPPEWTVLHARHWPGRSFDVIDHLAIGPNGIFVIDSVGWSGKVVSTPDVLEVNGRSRLTALQGAQDSAREVALLLTPDVREHVFPVICLSREEAVSGWVKAVRVSSTTTINDLIESRPAVLTSDEVDRISRELDEALPSSQPAGPEWHRSSAWRPSVSITRWARGRTSPRRTLRRSSSPPPDPTRGPGGMPTGSVALQTTSSL